MSRSRYLILLGVLTFGIFANSIPGTFLWDDQQFVKENIFMTSWRMIPRFFSENLVAGAGMMSNLYRPLQLMTHFLDVRIWGLDPWGHHLTNVLFQTALALVLLLVLSELLGRSARSAAVAFMASGLYVLHPLQSFAVAYVSGRGDTLVLLWFCLAALSFRRSLWLALIFTIAAFFTKENGLLAPLWVLGFDWVVGARAGEARPRLRRHAPLWGAAILFFVLRLKVLNFQNLFNFYGASNVLTEHFAYRVFTYFSTLPKALALVFFPSDLHHERSWVVYTIFHEGPVWQGALVFLGFLAASFVLRKRSPLAAFGCFWFIAATLPTSNVFFLINALFYDHWVILPALGICLTFAAAFDQILASLEQPASAYAAGAAGVLLALPLGWATWEQNGVWRDPGTLYSRILSYEPKSVKIINNYAMYLAESGQNAQAKALYMGAIRTSDHYAETHHNLAMLYLTLGETDMAASHLDKALRINPRIFTSWLWLGKINLDRSQYDEAIGDYTEALRIHPTPEGYDGLIRAYQLKGDMKMADFYAGQALRAFKR